MSRRAGRKRKLGIARQKNGQPSRVTAVIRENTKETVIGARIRQYGLTAANADTELAGYAIGRMALAGRFGVDYQPSLDVILDYVTAAADYMRIKWPSASMPKAMDYMAGRGTSLNPEPSLKTVERIERRYWDLSRKMEKADAEYRMWFHEAAFHDRLCGEHAEEAVIICVKVLQGA
jgi:hypothetical protein